MPSEGVDEKVAYLKGLTEGLDIGSTTKEGRILAAVTDVLDTLVDEMKHLRAYCNDLDDYVAAVDEDLTDLESDFYDEYDESQEFDDAGEGLDYVAMDCPTCRETVYVDERLLSDQTEIERIICPECGETLAVARRSDADGVVEALSAE